MEYKTVFLLSQDIMEPYGIIYNKTIEIITKGQHECKSGILLGLGGKR